MVTHGTVGNFKDLLKGVDAAITQSVVLDHSRRELKVPNIGSRIQYISPPVISQRCTVLRAQRSKRCAT